MDRDNWNEFVTLMLLFCAALMASALLVECRVFAEMEASPPLQHTKDPTKCKKVCVPHGWEGELPKEFPEGVETVECKGDYCARAEHAPPSEGEETDDPCRPHYSCSVHCSEVCCVCLRECI